MVSFASPVERSRIRFINPNSRLSTITMPELIRQMTFSRKAIFSPSGLGICASVMPSEWQAEIVDECTMDTPHVPLPDVDIVGITAMTTQVRRAYELADAYRALGVTVFLGGIHPSAMPEEAARHADAVCKGDGETCLPHMIADWQRWDGSARDRFSTFGDYLAANRREQGTPTKSGLSAGNREQSHGNIPHSALRTPHSPSGGRIYDWAAYPTAPIGTPRKDLLDPRNYLIFNPIQTTRGCPHSCSFCTTPGVFGRKFRMREIQDIVEEIKEAKERFRSWVFIFADDDFGGNHQWALEMCAALEPLKVRWASQCDILISRNEKLLAAMHKSGCLGLILGLESRKQDTLSESGKKFVKADSYEWRIRKIQSFGISLWGAFIFGFDHDNWQDLMFTCRFAQRMNLAMSCYPILTPYPGTGVWHEYRKAGRITSDDYDRYNGASVVYDPKHFTPQQLRHAQMAAFSEFYSLRSAFRRLQLWPVKKNAWLANVAICRGIRYYYASRGRPIPRFRDFRDPASPAWRQYESYADANGKDVLPGNGESCGCDSALERLAMRAVALNDPYRQAAELVAAAGQSGRPNGRRPTSLLS